MGAGGDMKIGAGRKAETKLLISQDGCFLFIITGEALLSVALAPVHLTHIQIHYD